MKSPRRLIGQPEILHRDESLLVVNKPAGVFLTPQPEGQFGVPDRLIEHVDLPPDEPFLITHRIHENASGAVVYARTPEAAQSLARQFEDGDAHVTYLALVVGYVTADDTIRLPVHYDKRAGRFVAGGRSGTPSVTSYRIVQRITGNTLLECRPEREIFDQVRAHLAAIGHPLTVDTTYGGGARVLLSEFKPRYRPSARREERPLIERLTLHCQRVELIHPATGERTAFEAPLPKDLRAALTQLERLQ